MECIPSSAFFRSEPCLSAARLLTPSLYGIVDFYTTPSPQVLYPSSSSSSSSTCPLPILLPRFAKLLTEKEQEVKAMFCNIEEATKLSTFWEKEYTDLKTAHAQQVLALCYSS